MKANSEVLSELIRVRTRLKSPLLDELAKIIFTAYTQNGLPPDFAFDEIEKHQTLTKDEKLYILSVYQDLDMDHKHKSGITPKRQQELQQRNRDTVASFLKTGEVGIF